MLSQLKTKFWTNAKIVDLVSNYAGYRWTLVLLSSILCFLSQDIPHLPTNISMALQNFQILVVDFIWGFSQKKKVMWRRYVSKKCAILE